jgi:hypothetical protein
MMGNQISGLMIALSTPARRKPGQHEEPFSMIIPEEEDPLWIDLNLDVLGT